MSQNYDPVIQFVEEHLPEKIDKDTYNFVKELYEYVSLSIFSGKCSSTNWTTISAELRPELCRYRCHKYDYKLLHRFLDLFLSR